jgi:hypothetical protein
MSNGLKNIQSHARAYSRRERLESGQPLTGYDDDSGISGIGLTPVDDMEPTTYDSPESGSSSNANSGSSTASQHGYSHMQPNQNSYQGYSYGAPSNPNPGHHGYTSSVSSSSTAGYGGQGHPSPYMGHGNRMPSVDMGIDAIINRTGNGHHGV